jgi:hypothetical protein
MYLRQKPQLLVLADMLNLFSMLLRIQYVQAGVGGLEASCSVPFIKKLRFLIHFHPVECKAVECS